MFIAFIFKHQIFFELSLLCDFLALLFNFRHQFCFNLSIKFDFLINKFNYQVIIFIF